MNLRSVILSSTLLSVIIAVSILAIVSVNSMPVYAEVGFDYITPMRNAVDIDELKRYVDDLVGFGSRFTGYPGCYAAADYIEAKFREFGLEDVGRHSFKLTIPLDEGAYIETSTGEKLRVYPLFPNRVCPPQTPPGGLKGRLVYVGYGDYSELDGKDLYGNIVVMEFNSQYRWITAAKFGASAVVFLEPEYTTSVEARMKQLETVAWNFVRVYAKGEEARRIRELADRGETVTLVSDMKWRTVESYNVIGYVYGQRRDEYVVISAQYDSFSWIPSIAPGAREAIGTAVMLQLARYFARNPGLTKYTLVFIAFSGTNQGVIGSRWFVKDYVEGRWT
ncbi:MAG: M28 family peptidase, partial [Candidatus Bathyarchaeia archaeon]